MSLVKTFFLRLYAIMTIFFLLACNDNHFTDGSGVILHFSQTEINFDTLLAPIGSGMAHFSVHNRSKQNIVIAQIALNRGTASPFRININGQPQQVAGMRLEKKDSIIIFVEVKADALWNVSDSVQFNVGGNIQHFQLRAYVQTAVIVGDTTFSSNVVFSNLEPYLFLGNAIIGKNATATVLAGSQLLFVRNKGLQVDGTLKVNGSKKNPVLFAAARHGEAWYADKKGQWEGIIIDGSSTGNVLEYAIINGANRAFSLMDTLQNNTIAQLTLRKCSISFVNSHICTMGGRIRIDSSMFSNKIKNDTIDVPTDGILCL
jgi:hypothetical protein